MINQILRRQLKIQQGKPQKKRVELTYSGRVGIICSASGTRRDTSQNKVMNMERTGLWLQQKEHTCGHLWNKYSVNHDFNLITRRSVFGTFCFKSYLFIRIKTAPSVGVTHLKNEDRRDRMVVRFTITCVISATTFSDKVCQWRATAR